MQPTQTPFLPDRTKSQHSQIYAIKLYSPAIHFSMQCYQNYDIVIKTEYKSIPYILHTIDLNGYAGE